MKIEITEEAFRAIVGTDLKCFASEHGELHTMAEYRAKGCRLFAVFNFVSAVSQYYIEDINA